MLNTYSAIQYNTSRAYSTKAVGIIQSVVNAPTKGTWDSTTVSQVHKFQSSRTSYVGSADGKVGPRTLGAVIGELQYAYRNSDAQFLKQWSHTMPSTPTQPGAINPVSDFWQAMTMPFRFERFSEFDPKAGKMVQRWRAACVFKLHVGLNPALSRDEACRFEYRQFIRGKIQLKEGTGPSQKVNSSLPVPPYAGSSPSIGLPSTACNSGSLDEAIWKEDGEVRQPKNRYYGHRISAIVRDNRCVDEWLPHGVGHDYYLSDQPSLTGTWKNMPVEVQMDLHFQGYVIEVEEDDEGYTRPIRVVQKKSWTCNSGTMRLSNYYNAVAV